MPKIKSKSGALKRFIKKGNGTFKFRRANRNHILTKKSSKRKRHLRGMNQVDATNHDHIQQCLPYV